MEITAQSSKRAAQVQWSHLKLCRNCEKVSTLPASGTMTLTTTPDVSTDALRTFIRGPNGRKRVTWRKLLESSLAKKSSYNVPLSRSVRYSPGVKRQKLTTCQQEAAKVAYNFYRIIRQP